MTANTTEENVTDKNKIQSITLKKFKAFYGEQTIEFGGKNVLIYGENGSGKSSLARALELLILGNDSVQTQPQDYRNIIAKQDSLAEYSLQIEFKTSEKIKFDYRKEKESGKFKLLEDAYHIDIHGIFLDYKKLADIHIVTKEQLGSIFSNKKKTSLIAMILEKFLTDGSEEIKQLIDAIEKKKSAAESAAIFSDAIKHINKHLTGFESKVKKFLEYFENNSMTLEKFYFRQANNSNANSSEKKIHNKYIFLEKSLNFQQSSLEKNQAYRDIFNEAKLSAISLSIYFAALQLKTKSDALNILILDDALTGLDMSNRLPVVKILLDKDFKDYQIFLLTHDREFYERIGNSYLKDWKKIEMYRGEDNFASPVIYSQLNYVEKANFHLEHHQYDVAGNFLRKEAERIVEELLPEVDQSMPKTDKWSSLKTNLTKLSTLYKKLHEKDKAIKCVELIKDIILNPSSHHNWATRFYKHELKMASDALRELSKLPRIRQQTLDLLQINYPCFLLAEKGSELFYNLTHDDDNSSSELSFQLQDDIFLEYTFSDIEESEDAYYSKITNYLNEPSLRQLRKDKEENPPKSVKELTNSFKKENAEIMEDWWHHLYWKEKNSENITIANKKEKMEKYGKECLEKLYVKDVKSVVLLKKGESLSSANSPKKIIPYEDIELRALFSVDSTQIKIQYRIDTSKSFDVIISSDKRKIGVNQLDKDEPNWQKDFKTTEGKSLEDLKNEILEK